MWRLWRVRALKFLQLDISRIHFYYYRMAKCSTTAHMSSMSESGHSEEHLSKHFISAMRNVPSAVAVVTGCDGVLKRGVTCSSFTSVSLNPPIISFTLTLHSRMHSLLLTTRRFAVNVLSEKQAHYSAHFSKPFIEDSCQFESIPHDTGLADVPLITGSCATLQCSAYDVHTLGDHHVWYGKVVKCAASKSITNPLLYYARSYHSVGDEAFMEAFEKATLGYEEWTHEAHLRMAWNYLNQHEKEEATPIIIAGIKNYIDQNYGKVKNVYNETVTRFFIHMVHAAIQEFQGEPHTFEEFLQATPHLTDHRLLSRYYSESRAHSNEARMRWLEPDILPLP